jgi:hypothetical protein
MLERYARPLITSNNDLVAIDKPRSTDGPDEVRVVLLGVG